MDEDLTLGSYSQESGLRLIWVPGYTLRVGVNGNEVTIAGNAEGLRSLAQHLLTLAGSDVPRGVHAHFEPSQELDDDSVSLVLDRT